MPRFDLSAVHRAAAEGRVFSGGPRYKEKLLPLLLEFARMVDFATAVIQELAPDDFIDTERYPNSLEMDAYGVAVSEELQERFGIEGFETWYVKFRLEQADDGEQVIMASLRGAEHPLRRVGGTIAVKFSRRME